jgi:hypothetical protein
MAQKRQREEGKAADASAGDKQQGSGSKATLGQQTSHIKNKLVRAELYAKLKHKQKVSQQVAATAASHWVASMLFRARLQQGTCCMQSMLSHKLASMLHATCVVAMA